MIRRRRYNKYGRSRIRSPHSRRKIIRTSSARSKVEVKDEDLANLVENLDKAKVKLSSFKQAMDWFSATMMDLHRVLDKAEDLEDIEKPKKRKTKNEYKEKINQYVGRKVEHYFLQMPIVNVYWLFDRIKQVENHAISLGSKGMLRVDENFKFVKSDYLGRQRIKIEGEYETFPFRSGFIIPELNAAFVWGCNWDVYKHGIVVVAQEEYIDEAIKWMETFQKKESIYIGRIMSIRSSGLEIIAPPKDITWDSIVPNEKARDEFSLLVDMLAEPEKYRKSGIPIKRGLLMVGPPGTGKTVHVKCLMNEVLQKKRPIIVVEELKDCQLSLRDVYDIAADTGPGLVIIEDIDTIAHNRDDEGSAMRYSFLQELLSVLDGEKKIDGVITVATSNFKERVDRALAARPGRFDVLFEFDFPEIDFKYKLLDNFVEQLNLDITAIELRNIEEVEDFLNEEHISCAHVYELCAGIQRKKILNPDADIKESAIVIAEQLKSVMQPDAGKHHAVRGFGG